MSLSLGFILALGLSPDSRKPAIEEIDSRAAEIASGSMLSALALDEMAKSKNISCKMMDNLLNTGDVGLVVVSDEALINPPGNPVAESKMEKIKEKNLPLIYYKAMGNKICGFHMGIIKEEIPEYGQYYNEIGFMDGLFGTKCPICEKLGGKKRG